MITPLTTPILPRGIRSRFVEGINGLTMHILEAGYEEKGRPCLLLLHGFPELAISWRKVMLPLAAAGFHVVAPDQRGYGRTTGWDGNYDGDLGSFRILNLIRDVLGLLSALGYRSVAGVIGHDFGSPVAAWCSLVRPDVFRSVALMSAPFAGPPQIPFGTDAQGPRAASTAPSIHDELARARSSAQALSLVLLDAPRRRQHAQGTPRAACLPARLLPLQERRLEREQALSARGLGRGRAWQAADLLRDGARQGDGRERRPLHADGSRDRGVQVADRGGARRLQRGVRAHRLPGWAQLVPGAHVGPVRRRAGGVLGPHHRRAGDLHRGQERLGHPPGAGRARAHAVERLHALAGHAPRRRRRALGAAGAARGHHAPAAGVPPRRGALR